MVEKSYSMATMFLYAIDLGGSFKKMTAIFNIIYGVFAVFQGFQSIEFFKPRLARQCIKLICRLV